MESVRSSLADGNGSSLRICQLCLIRRTQKSSSWRRSILLRRRNLSIRSVSWRSTWTGSKKTRSSLRNTGKKELIEVDNQKITVKHQCELLGLPRSTAYYKSRGVSEPSQEEVDIKNAVDKIRFDECAYGCRRIWNELRKQDFRDIGKRRVRRYMEEMGIVPFYSGPNLNKRELQERTYSYLLRNVAIMHVNQVWGIDITYCGTLKGFMYLVAIIDWHSRLISRVGNE